MAYTPINWQTGDTITADKLNKMDNGWEVENTQLFSETVTTTQSEYGNEGTLTYGSQVTSPTITVTFDGTDYQCSAVQIGAGVYGYGGVSSGWEYDFTTYPFAFVSSSHDGNVLATNAAGTYIIAVATDVVVASDGFAAAVAIVSSPEVFVATENATTWQEVHDAVAAKKLAFVHEESGGNLYCYPVLSVTSGSGYGVATAMAGGGSVETRHYQANTAAGHIYPADGPIYPN